MAEIDAVQVDVTVVDTEKRLISFSIPEGSSGKGVSVAANNVRQLVIQPPPTEFQIQFMLQGSFTFGVPPIETPSGPWQSQKNSESSVTISVENKLLKGAPNQTKEFSFNVIPAGEPRKQVKVDPTIVLEPPP